MEYELRLFWRRIFNFDWRFGRKEISLTRPKKYSWLFIAFISGLVFSILLYFLGQSLYKLV